MCRSAAISASTTFTTQNFNYIFLSSKMGLKRFLGGCQLCLAWRHAHQLALIVNWLNEVGGSTLNLGGIWGKPKQKKGGKKVSCVEADVAGPAASSSCCFDVPTVTDHSLKLPVKLTLSLQSKPLLCIKIVDHSNRNEIGTACKKVKQ